MSNLREHHLNRKAESAALRYLAQKEVAKTSKADWLCLAILAWFSITTIYLLITNLGV
tara:strand:- start:3003 stop:3176 length:174 start_codon:yes stop_codon:yes gene_type:complete